MSDKIEKLANDEIGVIVWPYGSGQKQIGLCFDDGAPNPAVIFSLPEEWAFLLRDAIFGTALRAEVAALRQQLDEALAWRESLNAAIREAGITYPAGARAVRDLAAMASGRLEELQTAEADNARLLDVYRAAGEALVLLWAMYWAWRETATVEAPMDGYVEMIDLEDSKRLDLAFSAIYDREAEIEAIVAASRSAAPAEPTPRVWTLPPEPGAAVEAVSCDCHGTWTRWPEAGWWQLTGPKHPNMGPYQRQWAALFRGCAPLTAVFVPAKDGDTPGELVPGEGEQVLPVDTEEAGDADSAVR